MAQPKGDPWRRRSQWAHIRLSRRVGEGCTAGGHKRIGVAHALGIPRMRDGCTQFTRAGVALRIGRSRASVLIRLQPDTDYLPVVFGFGRHGDLLALAGKHTPTAFAARVSLVLAGAHFGVLEAKASHFRREFDDRLLPLAG